MIGRINTDDLWNYDRGKMIRHAEKIIKYFDCPINSKCLDMGERNPKMEYIKNSIHAISVDQSNGDFNWTNYIDFYGKYDFVFALDVIEHTQNALRFMDEIKKCIKLHGIIYITMPSNPKFLWPETHYFEIPPKHFDKWILNPLGLSITKFKKFYFFHGGFGFRPLLKVLRGENSWKSFLTTLIPRKYCFYEIKKDSL